MPVYSMLGLDGNLKKSEVKGVGGSGRIPDSFTARNVSLYLLRLKMFLSLFPNSHQKPHRLNVDAQKRESCDALQYYQ